MPDNTDPDDSRPRLHDYSGRSLIWGDALELIDDVTASNTAVLRKMEELGYEPAQLLAPPAGSPPPTEPQLLASVTEQIGSLVDISRVTATHLEDVSGESRSAKPWLITAAVFTGIAAVAATASLIVAIAS